MRLISFNGLSSSTFANAQKGDFLAGNLNTFPVPQDILQRRSQLGKFKTKTCAENFFRNNPLTMQQHFRHLP